MEDPHLPSTSSGSSSTGSVSSSYSLPLLVVANLALVVLLAICLRAVTWLFKRLARGSSDASPPVGRVCDDGKRIVKTMVVLGSGGHTMEMLQLVHQWRFDVYRITFVMAETDHTSKQKLGKLIHRTRHLPEEDIERLFSFRVIPRSREVGQPWLSSGWTSLVSLWASVRMVFDDPPDLVLVNGPGTCIPVCCAALLHELVCYHRKKLVFVESFCRVKSLSLSGRLLYPLADEFIVSWEALTHRYTRAKYLGVLY